MHPILNSYFSFIKKVIPSRPDNACIGLDISERECRLVELTTVEDKFVISRWAIEPVLNGDVGASIKKIISKTIVSGMPICTAIFGKGTLIRYVDLPRMSSTELKNSFALEADKYFPFPQDQIYTDCFILDPNEKTQQMAVMAVAARKELVDQRIDVLKDAGFQVNFISTNAIVVVNALGFLGYPDSVSDDSIVAVLNIGDSISSLSILVDKLPRFTRDIFVGIKDFEKNVSNVLGVDEPSAVKLVADPADREQEVFNACESAIMNIVQELRLSFDYFFTEKNLEVATVLVSGEGAGFKGLISCVEKNLDAAVIHWDPIESMSISDKIENKQLKSKSSRMGVALGLALYDYA